MIIFITLRIHNPKKNPKRMKKMVITFLASFLLCLQANAQNANPLIWLRADDAGTDPSIWQDISGNGYDATFASGSSVNSDSLMNFNRCFYFDGATSLAISGLLSSERVNDVIIAYQADTTSDEEFPLWNFRTDSVHSVGLTTQRILNSSNAIRYREENEAYSIINSLSQLWRKSGMPDTVNCVGRIGVDDSSHFSGRIAEFVVLPCNETFSDTMHMQWCSYLAVKYGVTLKEAPYVSSGGKVIWPCDSLTGGHAFNVVGIGRDDHFGLHQKQSSMRNEWLTIGLGELVEENALNADTLADGSFLMMGCDVNGLRTMRELYLDNGLAVGCYGNAIVRITGDDIPLKATALRVNASDWQDSLQKYVLLVDRSGDGSYLLENLELFLPTHVDTMEKTLTFSDIYWDADGNGSDVFYFAKLSKKELYPVLGQRSETIQTLVSQEDKNNGNQGQYSLFPNPNSGSFVLEAAYPTATPLTVRIYSAEGKVINTLRSETDSVHHMEGHIPWKGHYMLEIISNEERNVVKMVVQ